VSRGSAAYRDPLDEIWTTAARRIGFTVARTRDAYARVDGRGTILVAEPDLLDADDSLAQMVLHELCHALVEGPDAWRQEDWGLCNQSSRDEAREHACLRLQAGLTAPHGLRRFLAATTEHRAFYDALPADPFDDAAPSAALAVDGLARAGRRPFAPHLEEALAATARVAAEAARYAGGEASLWSRVDPPLPRHPTGLLLGDADRTCGGCAWRFRHRGDRCRQAGGARVQASAQACVRWEAALDCVACGACCRAAFDSVTISRRDPVVRRHPELIVHRESYVEILREGDHCAALERDEGRYLCRIYPDRPRTCRDFSLGGEHCLDARRRVGLSR
jgi:hypothetical protein